MFARQHKSAVLLENFVTGTRVQHPPYLYCPDFCEFRAATICASF